MLPLRVLRCMVFVFSLGIGLPTWAGSTIDPTQPPAGIPYNSAPIRNNFQAAVSDVNGLLSKHSATAAPLLPVLGEEWLNTTTPTSELDNIYDGTSWVPLGSLNTTTHTWTPYGGGSPLVTSCATADSVAYYAAIGTNVSCLPSVGTAGQFLTSNGPGLAPTWQTPGTASNSVIVTTFGAKCDGATDDSAAFNAAISALSTLPLSGGDVMVPAKGHGCAIAHGITLPSGVNLKGYYGLQWPGVPDSVVGDWTNSGSYIVCQDTTNPCVHIPGDGNQIANLNFIYAQTAPPNTGSWTPVTFPYTILIDTSANFTDIENVSITAATHCIDMEGPSNGISGIWVEFRHILFNGCFVRGIKAHNVDNTVRFSNLRFDSYWNLGNGPMVAYMEQNKVDMDLQYIANPQMDNIEFFESAIAMLFTNSSVTSGFGTVTIAMQEGQISNVSFNEVCQAMKVANSATVLSGVLTNVIAYTDTSTSSNTVCAGAASAQSLFDLRSDSVNLVMQGLRVGFAQVVATLGNGVGGNLTITNPDVGKYSAYATASPAFAVATNALLNIHPTMNGYPQIRPGASAGPVVGPNTTQAFAPPIQVGWGGGTEGCVQLQGSADNSHAGSIAFLAPDCVTRRGFIGRGSSGKELNINSDGTGAINLFPNNTTAGLSLNLSGGKVVATVSGGLPTSPPSGTGTTNTICVDNANNLYMKATCP